MQAGTEHNPFVGKPSTFDFKQASRDAESDNPVATNAIRSFQRFYWRTFNHEFKAVDRDDRLFELLRDLDPQFLTLLFDVGFNKGFFTKLMLRIFKYNSTAPVDPMVYGFEPLTSIYQYSTKLFQRRYNQTGRVRLFNLGVSNGTARHEIRLIGKKPPFRSDMATLGQYPRDDSVLVGTVDTVALDEFVDQMSIRSARIPLVKIDVEGFEGAVFRGMDSLLSQGRVTVVFFECSDTMDDSRGSYVRVTLEEVVRRLDHFGYHVFYVGARNLIQLNGDMWVHEYNYKALRNCLAVRKEWDLLRPWVRTYNLDIPLADYLQ